jgi:dolichol-phosphate mannosyltransferase
LDFVANNIDSKLSHEYSPPFNSMNFLIPVAIAIVDFVFFSIFLRWLVLGNAHLASFAVSLLVGFLLTFAFGKKYVQGIFLSWQSLAFLALAACLLRGGMIALLVQRLGLDPMWAILPSIATSMAVLYYGSRYIIKLPSLLPHSTINWKAIALPIALFFILLRLLYMGVLELIPEEAYYWNYSQHLDIGYLDHPPMVAWLIKVSTWLFGQTEFGVRFCAPICWAATAYFTCRLTRNLFGKEAAWVALLLLLICPFYFVMGLLMMPDTSMLAAWAGTLFFLERALVAKKNMSWWGVGICLGFGMLSKYSIALLGLGTLIYIVIDPASRRWFLRWEPYAAAILAALLFSPVVLWNAQNEWASFSFQTVQRITAQPHFSLHWLILSALILITPLGFYAAIRSLLRWPGQHTDESGEAASTEDYRTERAQRFLFVRVFTLVPFAVFFIFSLNHSIKLDWIGPIWLAVIPAIAGGIVTLYSSAAVSSALVVRLKKGWMWTVALFALFYGIIFHYLTLGLVSIPYYPPFVFPNCIRDFARQIDNIEDAEENQIKVEPLLVGMDKNFIASLLAFYSPDHFESVSETSGPHLFGKNALMYARWFLISKQKGRTLMLVSWKRAELEDPNVIRTFESVGPMHEGELLFQGKSIRKYYYRICRNYEGPVAN